MANVKAPSQQLELTAEDRKIGIFLEYETLLLSDMTEILGHLSRAYDALVMPRFRAEEMATMREIGLDPWEEPLRLESAETIRSITLVCVGAAAVVLRLAHVAKQVVEARKVYWESEKVKWEAKQTEQAFQDTLESLSIPAQKAGTQIRQLLDTVNEATTIRVFTLKLGTFFTLEHAKGTIHRPRQTLE